MKAISTNTENYFKQVFLSLSGPPDSMQVHRQKEQEQYTPETWYIETSSERSLRQLP